MKLHRSIFQLMICSAASLHCLKGSCQLNSLGSYVWNATDAPRIFNDKLQLSFVNAATGFPSYGTVLAGGGYETSEDGGVFQIYFPYGTTFGGLAPKIRLGLYNNLGWSSWATMYTTANANNAQTDWSTRNLITYGNILVGKTSQSNTTYRIDVNGSMRADKLVVNTTGADYVFDSSYVLMPIDSLQSFLASKHHLPGLPSASDIKKQGIDVGESYTKLLEKIEILTRYILIQENTIKQQAQEINTLKNKLYIQPVQQ